MSAKKLFQSGVEVLILIFSLLCTFSVLHAESASTPPQGKKSASIDRLYAQFQDPPRQYTLHPYLFMNGKLDPARLTKQMQMMDSQGVYSTTVYGIDGLRTPYLSKEWLDNFGAMLAEAKRLNFELDFNADYDWPDGEARNPYALQPIQSRVIQADPSFQMRSLAYVEKDVQGPASVSLNAPDGIQFAVAAPSPQSGQLDGGKLELIQQGISGDQLVWKVPEGQWKVMAFYLKVTEGAQKDNVDKLNPKATQTFIKIGLDPYYERFGSSFGKNIRSLLLDHEGDYGRRIAWTPGIFEAFEKEKGYDLRKYIPLLVYNGGRITPKIRYDYLDFISNRYIDSFFNPIIDWARARNIEAIAQLWESPLMVNSAVEGNFFAIERQFSKTGVDCLLDTYKWPRDFMEAASISHFDKKGFGVEALGIQGYNSFIDLGGMRTGTYMIGAWGGSYLWALFNYDSQKANYPPDWFYVQPYWKYFKTYADAARRMSFMNSEGSKVASIAIDQPLEAIYAESSPIFNHDVVYPFGGGSKIAPLAEEDYSELIWGLTKQQWNYDIMDAHYLAQAGIENGALSLGGDHYRVLLLPAATTIRRDTFKKIEQFFDAGGVVIALGNLPKNSVEYGENDPELEKMVRSVFGDEIGRTPSSLNRSATGGQAYFFPGKVEGKPWDYWHGSKDFYEPKISPSVEAAIGLIQTVVPKDFRVIDGPADGLFFNHMVRHGIDFYWIVNNTEAVRTNTILLDQKGVPERWDADTGKRTPVFFHEMSAGTAVRLRLEPGDGAYLVFKPKSQQDAGACQLIGTNLDEFHVAGRSDGKLKLAVQTEARPGENFADLYCDGVDYKGVIDIAPTLKPLALPGPWKFKLAGEPVETPYPRTAVDPDGSAGTQWAATNFNDAAWTEEWVSPEVDTIRDWWALGAFNDRDNRGLFTEMPPDKKIDLKASYQGAGGKTIHWTLLKSPSYTIDAVKPFANSYVDPYQGESWSLGYLLTYIYSPDSREVEVGVEDPNYAAWVNGKRIALQDFRGFYSEPRQAWATFSKITLNKGWNSLLIKFARTRRLTVWVKDQKSPVMSPLVFSPTKTLPQHAEETKGFRWYRYVIPSGTSGMVLPNVGRPTQAFIDGQPVQADAHGVIHYSWDSTHPMIVALRIAGTEEVYKGPKFLPGETSFHLVDWASVGLPNYSGDGLYQTDFELPQSYLQQKVALDLGEVGVAARVKVNGHDLGYRVWKPFQFDVTPWVHAGRNHLEVLVTNSAANKRDVGRDRKYIQNVHPNGLLGPVRIVPRLDRELLLSRTQ